MTEGFGKSDIEELFLSSGFASVRFLEPLSRRVPIDEAMSRSPHADAAAWKGALGSPTIAMTGLYHGDEETADEAAESLAIAPFARSFHYREAAKRLSEIAGLLSSRTGIPKTRFRVFSNSRLPEKPLAMLCGLGFAGRNSLLIRPGIGSLWIIAGMTLPFPVDPDPPLVPPPPRYDGCRGCMKCVEACPTAAISKDGGLNPDRCIQAMTERLDPVPDEIADLWGSRLYGCQTCQSVCPYNSSLPRAEPIERGRIGASISARSLLTAGLSGTAALGELFRGTVLGQRYIDPMALVRNALICVGNTLPPGLERFAADFAGHPHPEIRRMANRAAARYRY